MFLLLRIRWWDFDISMEHCTRTMEHYTHTYTLAFFFILLAMIEYYLMHASFFLVLCFVSSFSFPIANFCALTIGCFLLTSVSKPNAGFIIGNTPAKCRQNCLRYEQRSFPSSSTIQTIWNDITLLDARNHKVGAWPWHSWWNPVSCWSIRENKRDDNSRE